MIIKTKTFGLWLGVLLSIISTSYVCAADVSQNSTLIKTSKAVSSYSVEVSTPFQVVAIKISQYQQPLSAGFLALTQQNNSFMSQHDSSLKLTAAYHMLVAEAQ